MALLESTLYQVDGSDIELVLPVSNDVDTGLVLILLNAAGIILVFLATHSVWVDGEPKTVVWIKGGQVGTLSRRIKYAVVVPEMYGDVRTIAPIWQIKIQRLPYKILSEPPSLRET